ncbi:hypothetical protein F5X68DRAFT_42449 [Plectosphaerella plurivora]|uniref:Uncharacterized protein n=1 Tax=Plectosphaerella plurivora TaxID=936078 RepID=A0A9P9A7V9_9PEZI|nr:hypothetical protein F5X68DRAFT_42449 [Plectosphaerella plurivora]
MNDPRTQYPPTSAANVYPSPGSMIYGAGLPPLNSNRQYLQEPLNGIKRDRSDEVIVANAGASPDEHTSPENAAESVSRKKQKRNKPTLSCAECVERKTKASDLLCVCFDFNYSYLALRGFKSSDAHLQLPLASCG